MNGNADYIVGPDADYTLTASATPNTNTPYTVYHYKENLAGGFDLADTDNLTGTTDTTATAVQKTYANYHFDSTNTNNVLSGNIDGDGSRKLYVYYKLDTYTLTLSADTKVSGAAAAGVGVSGSYTVKYGATVSLSYTAIATGYSFKEWKVLAGGVTVTNSEFVMPANNVSIQATSEPIVYNIIYNGNNGKGGKGGKGKGGDAPKNRFEGMNKGGSPQPNNMFNGGANKVK